MVNLNRFYTYAYLREDRTPYYIGKGKGNRIYFRKKKDIKPPRDKSRIIFLKQNLTEEDAFKHEIYMIDVFGRIDLGTGILRNETNGGDGASGAIRSPETKAKMSAAKKGENHPFYGKTHSLETRAKLSAANKGENHPLYGKTPSPETKEKIGAAHKGKTLSPETRAKLGEAQKGRTHSPETKAKISAANKGENHHMFGKVISPETRAKLSAAKKGKTFSPEHKAKLSEAQRKRRLGENSNI